jgi:two-component system NtrC family sensor kinase
MLLFLLKKAYASFLLKSVLYILSTHFSYHFCQSIRLLSLVEIYRTHYPTPVDAVQVKLEEVDIDFLAEDFVKLVGSIRIGAERIQKIVQSLNKFSRSDEEGCKSVDIHEGIDSTLMILQSRLKATPHRPEIKIETHIPLVMEW